MKIKRSEVVDHIRNGDYTRARETKVASLLSIFEVKDGAIWFPPIQGYNRDPNPYVVEKDDDGEWIHRPSTKPCTGYNRNGTCVHIQLAEEISRSVRAIRRRDQEVTREKISDDIRRYA